MSANDVPTTRPRVRPAANRRGAGPRRATAVTAPRGSAITTACQLPHRHGRRDAPLPMHLERGSCSLAAPAYRAKRKPGHRPHGRRSGVLVPMQGLASDKRRGTSASRPGQSGVVAAAERSLTPKTDRGARWKQSAGHAPLGSAEKISQRSRAAVPLFLAGVGHVPPGPRRSHPSGGGTRVRCREWMVEARRRPARAEVGSGHFASGAARLTVSHDPEEG